MQPDSSAGENSEREQAYSPLVRRLADEFGIDLATVPGTGPGGRVTRADVQHAAFGDPADSGGPTSTTFRPPPPSEAPTTEQPEPGEPQPTVEQPEPDQPHPNVERADAPREPAVVNHESDGTMAVTMAPPFTVFGEADAGRLFRAQQRLTEDRGGGLPLVALVVRLTVAAIDLFPELNTTFDNEQIVPSDGVHLLVAGASEEPLLLAHAERLSLIELTDRFTNGALSTGDPEADTQPNATFAIDYLVDTGIRTATAVLAPPAIAAITFGRPQPVVRLVEGQTHNVPIMSVTGTFDSRSVGTGAGARFLATVTSNIEDPILAFAD